MYRICVIAPEGYAHSACFTEIALLLKASLMSLKRECDVTVNELARDRINIILGYHLLRFEPVLRDYRYIPYQLEQLGASDAFYSDNIDAILRNATAVWDYSTENITFLKARGIDALHCPIGYHQMLEQIPGGQQKDIDVLFFGSTGPRRNRVLKPLIDDMDISCKVLFGVYGDARDRVIARSKIILNVHFYSIRIFEAVRISYLLNNRCFILSEEAETNPYPAVSLAAAPYENLVEQARYFLENEDERERIRMETCTQFRTNYPMVRCIEPLVKKK
jgi:hypothetical protein